MLDFVAAQVTESRKWQRLNGWAVVLWTCMLPLSIVVGWIYILAFTAILSVYANWVGHLSAWAAARAEAKQDAIP